MRVSKIRSLNIALTFVLFLFCDVIYKHLVLFTTFHKNILINVRLCHCVGDANETHLHSNKDGPEKYFKRGPRKNDDR